MNEYSIIASNDYLGESSFYLSDNDLFVWLNLAK